MTRRTVIFHSDRFGNPTGWITNSPEVGIKLRKIDANYDQARTKAQNLPRAEKIKAYRKATQEREDSCARVLSEEETKL